MRNANFPDTCLLALIRFAGVKRSFRFNGKDFFISYSARPTLERLLHLQAAAGGTYRIEERVISKALKQEGLHREDFDCDR